MDAPSPHIVIIAGEASGDLHAAHLVKALKAQDRSLTFSGLGGEKMQKAGVELYEDLTKISVVGFFEVLKHFGEFKRIFHAALKEIEKRRPAAVILVDYPGFNLRLAREIKKLNTDIKVVYYISPQVWAWKESRVRLIKENTDLMLVLFPFEKEFYAKHGLDAIFVGHPLLDTLKVTRHREQFLKSIGLPIDKLVIGLLPGSREKEVENLLPCMLEAAEILHKEFPKIQFLLMKAATINEGLLKKHLDGKSLPVTIIQDTYDGINASDICVVTSGTATFETALLQKPMVVVYKTSFLTWALAKWLVKIPYIAMANVMAGKKIVPECIQFDANGAKVARELKSIFTDEVRIAQMKSELKRVREALGESEASRRAAREVLKILH